MNNPQRAFALPTITADFVLGKTGNLSEIAQAVAAARL